MYLSFYMNNQIDLKYLLCLNLLPKTKENLKDLPQYFQVHHFIAHLQDLEGFNISGNITSCH